MKKTGIGIFIVLLFLCFYSIWSYETLQGKTELLFWDREKAFNGYTLFGSRGVSALIDMSGSVVHTWPTGKNPRLLEYNGNLLDAYEEPDAGMSGFREYDWDGNVVWEYMEKRKTYRPHHDWKRIYNKKLKAYTTLYIANKYVPGELVLAAGADPDKGPYENVEVDAVVEVDMKGTIVWEWWFFDHIVQDRDAKKLNFTGEGKTIADYPHKIDINLPGRPLSRDWLHCNSIDYNPGLGQVVLNSVQGELYIFDHDNTFIAGNPAESIKLAAGSKGDFLYRFGDPARYKQGDPPSVMEDWTKVTTGHKQIGGAHHVHWITEGLPGVGNLLIFNNGQYLFERTPQSYIFELNPYLDGGGKNTGKYVNPPEAGYNKVETLNRDTHKLNKLISKQVVWMYSSKSNQGFFSHIGSSAQRLPNGNTFICAMTEGHLFEVTADGEVVWEYVSPITNMGYKEVIDDQYPDYNSVFRAYRYAPDFSAFKGRELKSMGPLTKVKPKLGELKVQPKRVRKVKPSAKE
ncbi:MAG: aryl-sulfate sulfotransferase [Spirochaetales bacterium]|nr:aryl-sulfate sulfotransferase [Spirochaetales bacterium]